MEPEKKGNLTVSVVIPVYNGARTLPQVLNALDVVIPPPDEVIVVDDGSTDDSAKIAEAHRCKVVRLRENIGAAAAKNRGASAARSDVLLFIDADIVVPPDILAHLHDALNVPGVDAVVGVLDPNIPTNDFPSQFKNLWMNYSYTRFSADRDIGLFYTSVAAIYRECFRAAGGFDEGYRGASIAEDTEFGQRAWGQGIRIRLDPRLAVVHLKHYTLGGVLREDFRRARALMLMRLRKWRSPFFTSVPVSYQLAVPTIYLTLAAIALTPFWILAAVIAIVGIAVFYLLNAELIRFLYRARGPRLALGGAFFLPIDTSVVGVGMLVALLQFLVGIRY